MGATPSLPTDEAAALELETGFSRSQLQRFYKRFKSLDTKNNGYLTRDDFFEIRELYYNPLGDRIIEAFFIESARHAKDQQTSLYAADDRRLTFAQFVRVLSYFQPLSSDADVRLNSRENKLRFAFSMYDLKMNNVITRDEFKYLLAKMIGSTISESTLDEIVNRTIEEADVKKDGIISFEEFCLAMRRTDISKMSIRFAN